MITFQVLSNDFHFPINLFFVFREIYQRGKLGLRIVFNCLVKALVDIREIFFSRDKKFISGKRTVRTGKLFVFRSHFQ